MKGALDAHRALLAADVPHEVVRLATPVATADELPAVLGLDVGCLAVRCYRVAGGPRAVDAPADAAAHVRLTAVLVPAGTAPSPAVLREVLGARAVRPASPAEVNAATDCAAELVCPVGLPPDVELIADAAVGRTDVVYVPVGESGLALGIRIRHLLLATRARVAALTPVGTGPEVVDLADVPAPETAPRISPRVTPGISLELTGNGHVPSARTVRAT